MLSVTTRRLPHLSFTRSNLTISQSSTVYSNVLSSTSVPARRYQSTEPDTHQAAIPRYMITTALDLQPHRIVGVCGLVQGNTVRTRNVARDYLAGIRALFGGELTTYTTLMAEAREEAIQRMIQDAIAAGANAIVSVRMTTNNLASNASELMAYGTGVIVEEGEHHGGSGADIGSAQHIDEAAEIAKHAKPIDLAKPTI